MSMDTWKQVGSEAMKAAPPTAMSMWLTIGGHIDDWIKICTLVYIIVQCTALVVTKYLQWRGKIIVPEQEKE